MNRTLIFIGWTAFCVNKHCIQFVCVHLQAVVFAADVGWDQLLSQS